MKKIEDIFDQLVKTLQAWNLYNTAVVTFKIISILLVTVLVVKIGSFIITKVFEKQKSFKYGLNNKRVDTVTTLSRSIFRYAVYLIATVTILTDVFNLKSVLAAAGVGGLAIGFGAQSLIKDFIAGFFIVMEDQFVVGDLITIESMTGTVEEMELRVTKIRNFNGDLYIIPNGEIKKVTNHTRGNKAAIVDIPIAYDADTNMAFEIANQVCEQVNNEFGTIVEAPKVVGITELGKENIVLRIMAKTLANEQWDVERRIRKLVKEEFNKAHIEFFGKNKILFDKNNAAGGNENA